MFDNPLQAQSSSVRRVGQATAVRTPTAVKTKIRRTSAQDQPFDEPEPPQAPAQAENAAEPAENPPRQRSIMSNRREAAATPEEIAPGAPAVRSTQPAPHSVIRPYHSEETIGEEVDSFFSEGESCGPGGCDDSYLGWCGDCRRGIYATGEVLAIWGKGQGVPALVSTSPVGTARAAAGVLPNATVVYGNDDLNTKARSGGRGRVGFWLTDCFALEAEYVALGMVEDRFTQTSSAFGTPTIARPFFNAGNNLQGNDSALVAFNDGQQGIYSGEIRIETSSSFEASSLLVRTFSASRQEGCCEYRADWLIGYRYARLRDNLVINSSRTSISNTEVLIPINTVFDVRDSFETENRFMGADLGLFLQCRQGCWTLDFTGRLGIGSVARQVNIDGQSTVTVPNAVPFVTPGGLLAQRTNMGRFRDDEFGFLPEANLKLGLDISPLLRLSVGYNFFALTNVARAGEQIDTNLNLSQASAQPLVGVARPAFNLVDTDYWAHGISFGLEGDF